ncbi:putative H/ACA ribonucleoprotein complex non-core subunit Naf1 [Helianthus annuus]|nr:putative H/ACA ribonucleoprotein complex non-core subunit Naf1 [Helianthus annuus]
MGYAPPPTNNTKLKPQQQPLDQSFVEVEDSFLDTLLNFEGWVEDHPNISLAEVMNPEQNPSLEQMNTSEGSKNLGDLIEEQIGKVCLTSGAELKEEVNDNNVSNGDVDNGEVKTVEGDVEDSEEEDESSSSGNSSSSDDDDDEEEEEEEGVKGEGEMEEGEIKDEVIAWSDADDEDGDGVKGPIRSKNEVQVMLNCCVHTVCFLLRRLMISRPGLGNLKVCLFWFG